MPALRMSRAEQSMRMAALLLLASRPAAGVAQLHTLALSPAATPFDNAFNRDVTHHRRLQTSSVSDAYGDTGNCSFEMLWQHLNGDVNDACCSEANGGCGESSLLGVYRGPHSCDVDCANVWLKLGAACNSTLFSFFATDIAQAYERLTHICQSIPLCTTSHNISTACHTCADFCTIAGEIAAPGQVVWFSVTAEAGTTYEVRVDTGTQASRGATTLALINVNRHTKFSTELQRVKFGCDDIPG